MKQKKLKKGIFAIALAMALILLLTGCEEASRVSHNISKEADNFNVWRRLAVINTVSGEPVFELVGKFSITADTADEQLEVTVEVAEGNYKKHIIGLNKATTMYVVEDIHGSDVSKYKYEINYLPEMIQPFKITSGD